MRDDAEPGSSPPADVHIRPGLERTIERVVDDRLLTKHVGGRGVFATPAMIGLMEWASHEAIEAHVPEGQTSVGYEVHVRHLAPAPPGSTVVVHSKLIEVNGNRLVFEVSCELGDKLIGTGTHKRAIVPANF